MSRAENEPASIFEPIVSANQAAAATASAARRGKVASNPRRVVGAGRGGTIASAMAAVRIVVVDDSALIREGIVRMLGRCGFAVVGEAAAVSPALELVARLRPD